MYDKPSRFCQPSHKSHTADSIIVKFWVDFYMTFVLASGQPTTHSVRAGAFTIYKSKAN